MSLFGNNLNKRPTESATTGSLFTSPQKSAASPFSFNTSSSANNKKPVLTSSMSFQAPDATKQTTLFGTPATTSSSMFSLSTSKPATGLFGQTTAQSTAQSTTSGFGFGAKPNNTFGSGLFQNQMNANKPATGNLFGNQSNLMNQNMNANAMVNQQRNQQVEAFYASLSQPLILGDERDNVLAKWNQMQAMWGKGVGYCSLGTVQYTLDNAFSRFKAIAYNVMPTSSDANGFVRLVISRPFSEVISQKQNIKDMLFRTLGSRLNVFVEEIRPSMQNKGDHTELTIRVTKTQQTGSSITVPATELVQHMSVQTTANQLKSQLAVIDLTAEIAPSSTQLAAYFDTPPAGFDRLVWQQFRAENPAPDCLLPVPLIGLNELLQRKKDQIYFGEQQSVAMEKISQVTKDMKSKQLAISQNIFQLKRKQIDLSHRILKVMARQEIQHRSGYSISPEEETLRCGLERLWSELLAQHGLRNRTKDLMCSFSVDGSGAGNGAGSIDVASSGSAAFAHDDASAASSGLHLDDESIQELTEYLAERTKGINEMRVLLNEMSGKLKIMQQQQNDLSHHHHSGAMFDNHTAMATEDDMIFGRSGQSNRVKFAQVPAQ